MGWGYDLIMNRECADSAGWTKDEAVEGVDMGDAGDVVRGSFSFLRQMTYSG